MNGYEMAIRDSANATREAAEWKARARRAEAEVRRLRERRAAHSLRRQAAEQDAAELRAAGRQILEALDELDIGQPWRSRQWTAYYNLEDAVDATKEARGD